ncbi:uncharacterized protein BX663DRAFT_522359, partial [Cokeromyces recurvatus]|uniref:uncharacterized protein n=1 Tax=Cokeromyces recurvatus TaxID=90255 RepID=UPI002220B668
NANTIYMMTLVWNYTDPRHKTTYSYREEREEQSRRDDLESLGHVFIIGEKKQTTQVKDLCDGFPDEFGLYLQYTRHLKFEEDPNYEYLKCLFDKVLESLGEKDDGIYDWMLLNDGKGWEVINDSKKKKRRIYK